MLANFFFSWFLNWLPLVFTGLILLVVVLNYFKGERNYLKFIKKLTTKRLIYLLIGATIFFDLLLSILQYFVWREAEFSRFFLPPFQSINYFFGYSLLHFFAANILVLIFAGAFYLLLRLFKKYRDDAISKEELSLFLLVSLLVSWPNFVILFPLFLLLTVIFSSFNLLVLKKQQTGIALPIIISAIIIFFFGGYLINFLSLSVLVI